MFQTYGSRSVLHEAEHHMHEYGDREAGSAAGVHVREVQQIQMHEIMGGRGHVAAEEKHEQQQYWSTQETLDFIAVRSEMEGTRRNNRGMWDGITAKLREKGYGRTAEQCKRKWKSLIDQFKGMEGLEVQERRNQCPFYDALQAVFTRKPALRTGESGLAARRQKPARRGGGEHHAQNLALQLQQDPSYGEDRELCEEEEEGRKSRDAYGGGHGQEEEVEVEEEEGSQGTAASWKGKRRKRGRSEAVETMEMVMGGLVRHQQRMEALWRESMARREEWRAARDTEMLEAWKMAQMERMAAEERWRLQEEERRKAEDAKADARDALFRAILTRLAQSPPPGAAL